MKEFIICRNRDKSKTIYRKKKIALTEESAEGKMVNKKKEEKSREQSENSVE